MSEHEFSSKTIGLFKWNYIDGKLKDISSAPQKFKSSNLVFSPNGKYCVAYTNLDIDGRKNDVLFFSDKQHIATISVKDTLSAKVKDDGYFSLEYFGDGETKKRTSVYNPKGEKIVTLEDWFQKFEVSRGGEILATYPEESDDGFKPSITFFNIATRRKISFFCTIPGSISFDFSNNVTTVKNNEIWVKYSLKGDVIESSIDMEVMDLILPSAVYWGDQIENVRKYIKKENIILETVATMLDKHLDTFTDKSVSSLAYRAKGELAEKSGNIVAAIAFYEKALAIDPKIGVKQHLKKLQIEAMKWMKAKYKEAK
jgi:tetratricopeptide (TPR) repeat protein